MRLYETRPRLLNCLVALLTASLSPIPATAQGDGDRSRVVIAPFGDEATGNVTFGLLLAQAIADGGPLQITGAHILSQDQVGQRLQNRGIRLPEGHVSCVVGRQIAHLFPDVSVVLCGSVGKIGNAQLEIRATVWSEPWIHEIELASFISHDPLEAATALRMALDSWLGTRP